MLTQSLKGRKTQKTKISRKYFINHSQKGIMQRKPEPKTEYFSIYS